MLLVLFAWPNSVAKRALSLHKSSLAQLDVIGLVLLTAATVLLIVGLQEAGSAIVAWDSSITIGLLTASGVSAIGLVAWTWFLESRGDRTQISPMFPSAFLKRRVLLGTIIVTLLTGFHLFLVIVQLPEHFQIVNGTSAISSGVRLMPLLFASALGSTVASLASRKQNNTFYTIMAASSFLLIGSGLLSTTSTSFHLDPAIYGYQVIFGLGIGMTFSTSVIVTTIEAPLQYYALALGVVNQARILGGTIGLAISTIIFNIRIGTELKGILSPAQITALRQTLNSIPDFSLSQQAAISHAFALSFNSQLRVCMYVAAVCWVVSACTWSAKATPLLKRKEMHDAAIENPDSEEVRKALKEELGSS
ncbi:MAG: hypothetical protein M1822_002661 [Bathelium mastoideum]|nr:MAG: hypothetical protein M1822_002661 [Bathelium mastoideum]